MEVLREHWLGVLLMTAYTGVLFYNAYVGSRASRGMAGYYVGGRNMGGVALGISFYATFASTNSYIGNAGKSYAFGLPWLIMAAALVLFTWGSWRWLGPKIRHYASQWDALTLPDFIGSRYLPQQPSTRHPLRLATAAVIVFSSLLYLVAVFKGAGHLFQRFLDIPYESAIGLTLVIVMLYTSIGGFVSVVRTDVVQGLLMVCGSLMLFYFVTDAAGGVGAITQLAEQPETEFLFDWNGGIPFAVLLGISLSGSLKVFVDPRQVSRFYALRDEAAVRVGCWVAVIGLALVLFTLFPIGIYAHLLLDPVSDTDLIVPTLVADPSVFPLWAADFLMLAIMAAAMSSMDSVLLVAASTLFKNLLAPFSRSQQPLTWTRAAVIGFAVLAAGLALNPPGDIVQITIFSGSLYAVCFFPAVVVGLAWRRGSAAAVLCSMLLGTVTLLLWMVSGLNALLHEVFPALAVSLVSYAVVSWFSPPLPSQAQ